MVFCAMAGLGGQRAPLLIHSQQGFLPAPALSSQDPNHGMQQQALVSHRVRKLSQREALEQHESGHHKLFSF